MRLAESGVSDQEMCLKMGVTDVTFYRWKKKFAGMGVAEPRRFSELEEENKNPKQLVANLSLDEEMLLDVNRKKL